ncbi:DUF1566 domain-containing protein [Algibacter sp.]|nr:hypothetical protein [Algibacter sp.]MDB4274037.1 DUF1566 domain-containing protein [Algibacter sp.]
MKKLYTILAALLLTAITFAQTPEKMSYQAVVRGSGDNLLSNQVVGMQISILQGSASGAAVYEETQTPTTNINGLVTLEIGTGSVVSGDFTTIDWSADSYFIKTETDPTGGTSYTITGTSQLLSVPYALHAKTAESVTSTCGLSIGETYQGGIIFYLDASGCHGLIAAPDDQSTSAAWWNGSYMDTRAYGSGLFEGKYNTKMINLQQGGTTSAAAICANYGDLKWYLPSIEELNLMYENIGLGNALGLGNVGNLGNGYWSSTEYDNGYAGKQNFNNGNQNYFIKTNTGSVRAVRAF